MQEPEQRQQFGQQWQASQQPGEYTAEYPGNSASDQQQEYIEVVAGDDSQQQQKIYPQQEWSTRGKALGIIAIILSSLGFFISVAGIVISALVLKFANGQEERLAGGVAGLVGSIVVMLVCIAIFVTAVIVLSLRGRRRRRWTRARM
jgi:phosphotransferase system  glucose/maltose/N-acetylglucosamine-specific IIC component